MALPPNAPPEPYGPPLLTEAAELHAFYVWLESSAWDRRGTREWALDLRVQGPWHSSAFRRCATALLWYVAGYDAYFEDRYYRGILSDLRPTEAGLAMFSAHLGQQVGFWRERGEKSRRCRDEVAGRIKVIEEVSGRFHALLGLNPDQVCTRARHLALDTHPRSGRFLRWNRDGSVEVCNPKGPLPRDDRDDDKDYDDSRWSTLDG